MNRAPEVMNSVDGHEREEIMTAAKQVKKVVTTTTTVTEDETSSRNASLSFRPQIAANNIIITRTGAQQLARRKSSQQQSLAVYGSSSNLFALASKDVVDFQNTHEEEKSEMNELNARLAEYIEQNHRFGAENKELRRKLEKLTAAWGKETQVIKQRFEVELKEARRLNNEEVKKMAQAEVLLSSAQEDIQLLRTRLDAALKDAAESRQRADRNNEQLSSYEGEIALLRRRIQGFENDHDNEKDLLRLLQDALNAARTDLNHETIQHIEAENERHSLQEELDFLKVIHEQEMQELKALQTTYNDFTSENREFWKIGMGNALREIQVLSEEKIESTRVNLELSYNLKVQELRTGHTRNQMESVSTSEETKRLKNQLGATRDKFLGLESKNAQLQREYDAMNYEKEQREREMENEIMELKKKLSIVLAEMDAMFKEFERIVKTGGLGIEIGTYRSLLDGAVNRAGLRKAIDDSSNSSGKAVHVRTTEISQGVISDKHHKVIRTTTTMADDHTVETSSKNGDHYIAVTEKLSKATKGPIDFTDMMKDGSFITLYNYSNKVEKLGGWKVTRKVDGASLPDFEFPAGFVMKSGELKIWSKRAVPAHVGGDLVYTENSWGVGDTVETVLITPSGEIKALHVRKPLATEFS